MRRKEAGRLSGSFVSISRCFTAEPSPGCLFGCTMCELPGGVADDENGVAKTRTRAAYIHRRGRRHQLPTQELGRRDDLFHREKPLDVHARSRPLYCSRARPGGDSVWAYMRVKFPVSTFQPNNAVAGDIWQRNTTRFQSLFVGKLRARWFALTGTEIAVQFPVITVHTCRLLRNVQQPMITSAHQCG